MRNIFYFLKKYGDKNFEEFPFNEVDSLILCQLAYLGYAHMVPTYEEQRDSLRYIDIIDDDMVIIKMCENTLEERYNRRFLRLLRKKKRYASMFVNYYRNEFDPNSSKQFSALTFLFDDFAYIAYQGTGPTLVGWKEDFNIAILDEIPAQEEAVEYLNDIADRYDGPIYIGGHSKGGNLVSYAVVHCREDICQRIIHIYNNDGPGFKKTINESFRFDGIKDRFTKYIPEDSLIGLLLHHTDKYSVVKCYGRGLIQHDPFLWKVSKDGHLQLIKDGSFRYRVFERANREWIDSISDDDRVRFINGIFYLVGVNGNIGILDIKKHPIAFIRSLRKRYKKLTKEEHKFLRGIIRQYPHISKKIRKELKKEKKQSKKAH